MIEVTDLTVRRTQTFEVEDSKSNTSVGYVLENGRNTPRERKLAARKVQFDLASKFVKCLTVVSGCNLQTFIITT